MKIAFLFNEFQPHVIARASYFIKQGHEVFYFALWSPVPVSKKKLPQGLKYISVPCKFPMNLKYIRFFRGLFHVSRLTKKYSIDVLHMVSAGNGLHSILSHSKVNVIQNLGSDMLVWPNKRPILKILYNFFYKNCDAVIQDSYLSQNAGIKYGAPKNNNLIIETGIDLNQFRPDAKKGIVRKKLKISDKTKIILSPRNLSPNYNIDIILKSIPKVVNKINDVVFVFIYFSNPFENKYRELVKDLEIDRHVYFVATSDDEKICSYYIDSDIVVSIPSSDSSPSSVYEAIACNKPIIISEIPWYHKKFVKNQHLITVPVRNHNKLATKIIDYLNGKIKLNKKEARYIVESNMDIIKENKRLEDLYENLLFKK